MSNMSYCRFTNTLSALQDCMNHMDANLQDEGGMADEEDRARKNLIELCKDIAEGWGDEIE